MRLLYVRPQKWLHRSKRDFRGGGARGASKRLLEGRDVWPPADSRLKFWLGASPFLRFHSRIYSERCVRPQWVKNGGCSVSDSSLVVDVGAFVGPWMSISDATVRSYRQCGTCCEGHKHEQRGLRNGDEISPLQRGHAKCTRLHQAEPYLFPRWRLLPFGRAIESGRCSRAWRRAKSASPGEKQAPAAVLCR